MSANDNTKISLGMLRGKSSTQSVPSISFRFNPGSDDLIKITENEENENLLSCSIPEFSPEKEHSINLSRESSPSRRESRSLNQRSSSLDETANLSPDTPTPKTSDSSSLISRITKTFEHKINEIRNEKQREKESKQQKTEKETNECIAQDNVSITTHNTEPEKVGSSAIKALDSVKRFSLENKDTNEISSSPSKSKTTLVQDFTEQKNKFKSDFNKSIRPKISELRNRKSTKESNTGSPKIKSSLLQSLLGRDESLIAEELLHECHAVETAVEAYEEVEIPLISERESSDKPISNVPELISMEEKHTTPEKALNEQIFKNITMENYKFMLRLILLQFMQELMENRSSLTSRGGLCLFFFCFILPVPRFLAGALLGASLMGALLIFIFKKVMPSTEVPVPQTNYTIPLNLGNEESLMHVGWMNELDTDYYPEKYHVSQTHTVFLRLQGSILQVDNSRIKISKHARPNEEPQYGGFVHHREYDLAGCEVLLLPKNLPRRWLWSRKYPIFIRFQPKGKSYPASPTFQDSLESTPTQLFKDSSSIQHSLEEEQTFVNAEENLFMENVQGLVEDDVMSSSMDLGSYEEVTQDMCQETSLCLFARTDREKDDWFRWFVTASETKSCEKRFGNVSPSPIYSSSTPETEVMVPSETGSSSFESDSRENSVDAEKEGKGNHGSSGALSFDQHMGLIMDQDTQTDVGVSWFNSFVGRVLFDFLHDKFWANKIQERIQRKLSKLHIPYFVGEIVVSGIDLGNYVPQMLSAGRPTVDHRGLWADFEVSYSGSFKMTLETKLDLMKLKARSPSGAASSNPPSPGESPGGSHSSIGGGRGGSTRAYSRSPSSDCVLRNVQFDTDTDDSVESSSEEDTADDEVGERVPGGGPASKRFLRIVDTVATSRYFQQASEWRLLQKAMKGVSNTRIELGVEVKWLKGTLTLNVPPAPSDRIWYGFRGSPELIMVAKPGLGDRQLDTLPFLAEFIQKQLRTVFEKVFVLPNMDDLVIPVMSPLLPGQKLAPRTPWEQGTQAGNPPSPFPKASPTKRNLSVEFSPSFLKLSKSVNDEVGALSE